MPRLFGICFRHAIDHDRRYAIDASKLESELGWRAAETFESGLAKTLQRYLDHRSDGGQSWSADTSPYALVSYKGAGTGSNLQESVPIAKSSKRSGPSG